MRIVAIVASYNEKRFIRACLDHYYRQGIEVYLLDNESTDGTIDIAREYLGRNLIKIEHIPRQGMFQWKKILMRKEQLADELQADWLLHGDPDEFRVAPNSDKTLAEAIAQADLEGYNAINFMDYTFLPTRESPDHDHADFQNTMLWYYPYAPRHPYRVNAWKKQPRRWHGISTFVRELAVNRRWGTPSVNLHDTGGHLVRFPDARIYPVDFKLKHYLVLSLDHAIQKYVRKSFDPKEVAGYHGWRATANEYDFLLPSEAQMLLYTGDNDLDATDPLTKQLLVEV